MSRTLLLILQDPLRVYAEKGEIKPGYYNPGEVFDDVHAVSFSDGDVPAEQVRTVVGSARLTIHPVGRWSLLTLPRAIRRISRLITDIRPSVIRAYDPFMAGWLSVRLGARHAVPSVVSVHCDLNPFHRLRIEGLAGGLSVLKQLAAGWLLLPYTLKHATRVVCAYAFAAREIPRYRAGPAEVLYNKVYLRHYAGERSPGARLRVLCVGRHIRGKDPSPLIRAVASLDGVELILIGQGPLSGRVRRLVSRLGAADRVRMIPSLPSVDMPARYCSSDVFALPILYGGVSIPVLEAMAAGLPVVVPRPLWEAHPEVIGPSAITVDNTPEGFRAALMQLRDDAALRQRLGAEGREKLAAIEGTLMEAQEAALYRSLGAGTVEDAPAEARERALSQPAGAGRGGL